MISTAVKFAHRWWFPTMLTKSRPWEKRGYSAESSYTDAPSNVLRRYALALR